VVIFSTINLQFFKRFYLIYNDLAYLGQTKQISKLQAPK